MKIEKETRSAGVNNFSKLFSFYKKLSGMTGTGLTSKEEFFESLWFRRYRYTYS